MSCFIGMDWSWWMEIDWEGREIECENIRIKLRRVFKDEWSTENEIGVQSVDVTSHRWLWGIERMKRG